MSVSFPSMRWTEMHGHNWLDHSLERMVGSFTGEKATIFRKKYADAFDQMEAELKQQQEPKTIDFK